MKFSAELLIAATTLLLTSLLVAPAILPTRSSPNTVNVSMVDNAFQPASIKVVIGVNNTVTWTNTGSAPHTATANGGSFDSPTLSHGQSFDFIFSTPGTFAYHCNIHPAMTGTILVVSNAGTTTGTTSTTTASTSSSSGQGIPEFPFQLTIVVAVTALLAASYLLVRRSPQLSV